MIMTGIKKTVSFCITVILRIKQIRHISHFRHTYLFDRSAFFRDSKGDQKHRPYFTNMR